MRFWLKKIRKTNNWTQVEISKEVGISQQYYNFIENGTRRPSPEVAKKIAKILDFEWTKFFE